MSQQPATTKTGTAYGWKGKDDSHAGEKLLGASIALRHTGVSKDLIIRFNDSGKTFDG